MSIIYGLKLVGNYCVRYPQTPLFVGKLPTPRLHINYFSMDNTDLPTNFDCYLRNSSVDKLNFSCSENYNIIHCINSI